MGDITLVELNLEGESVNLPFGGNSMSAEKPSAKALENVSINLPFSGGNDTESTASDDTETDSTASGDTPDTDGGTGKAIKLLGVLVVLAVVVALAKYLTGSDE